jgi:hypothetical protein
MTFEIPVHALLLEVISESRLLYDIGIELKLVKQLFLFFASRTVN